MKKLSTAFVALVLAALAAFLYPAQVLAESGGNKYISEIKLGVGKKAEDALASLEGYEILKGDDGKPVDLNKNAGGGVGSKGDRVVYLGFKKTSNRSEAITDLATMNMNGGYKVKDYEMLMETQMKEQIIPFVNVFLAAIEEYRENYNSANASNKARAQYVHDVLNKYTDDDCGGAGLGDLFLNETKFEMGDAAYNALSDAEKKQHADILTIVAQANGKSTLMIENLLTRAADTADDSWIDRLSEMTYEDMEDETGLSPSKAHSELSKLYYDDAEKLLDVWDDFRGALLSYEEDLELVENFEGSGVDGTLQDLVSLDENSTAKEVTDAADEYTDAKLELMNVTQAAENIALHDYLEGIEYDGGTLLDFFTQPAEDLDDNESITALYPLIASFSDGQRAGLEFVSLKELCVIAATDGTSYGETSPDEMEEVSIYAGVDRGIYEPGGVALTSDALRTDAMQRALEEQEEGKLFSDATIAMMAVTGAAFIAFTTSAASWITNATKLASVKSEIQFELTYLKEAYFSEGISYAKKPIQWGEGDVFSYRPDLKAKVTSYTSGSSLCKWLTAGFGIATVIITGITVWLTFRDLKNHYKVDYTPIPHYIVDEKDITAYNARGEKIVIKNQAAYYRAALCNRTSDAEFYDVLGEIGDLNGDVGKQWLALYAERNDAKDPILASSFKVTDKEQIPAGYETGIHMFGSSAAENLNNPLYVWKSDAPKVFVYFKLDVGAASGASAAGSGFSVGSLALGTVGGALIGVFGTAFCMKKFKKKKEEAAA